MFTLFNITLHLGVFRIRVDRGLVICDCTMEAYLYRIRRNQNVLARIIYDFFCLSIISYHMNWIWFHPWYTNLYRVYMVRSVWFECVIGNAPICVTTSACLLMQLYMIQEVFPDIKEFHFVACNLRLISWEYLRCLLNFFIMLLFHDVGI